MAGIFRGQGRSIAALFALLMMLLFASLSTAVAQLYERPVLVIDPGMHTAPIHAVGVNAAGSLAVTGADDKTVRVWSLTDGSLMRTIRVPAGPGDVGKIYAVAMSPEGDLIAAGGWTNTEAQSEWIYFFDARTGKITTRISSGATIHSLAFSREGRYLAAGLGEKNGLRIYDRDGRWSEIFRDPEYGDNIYGLTFDADGRLATASEDGKIRLYDRNFGLAVPPSKVSGGRLPYRIAFSPDGTTLAVGYRDVPVVELFDAYSLALLPSPNFRPPDIADFHDWNQWRFCAPRCGPIPVLFF
jgi:WD40 repeat protein